MPELRRGRFFEKIGFLGGPADPPKSRFFVIFRHFGGPGGPRGGPGGPRGGPGEVRGGPRGGTSMEGPDRGPGGVRDPPGVPPGGRVENFRAPRGAPRGPGSGGGPGDGVRLGSGEWVNEDPVSPV